LSPIALSLLRISGNKKNGGQVARRSMNSSIAQQL
jgi:hypothetical protein